MFVNDIVYFKLKESPLKADWRLGKVDNIKIGRDGKVREANIAYKIFKDGTNDWSHNVVTRPVRELVKLFEVGDTTFAQDMKLVHETARNILIRRGAIGQEPMSKQISSEGQVSSMSLDPHTPFLSCVNACSWLEDDTDVADSYENNYDITNDIYNDKTHDKICYDDEIMFLI